MLSPLLSDSIFRFSSFTNPLSILIFHVPILIRLLFITPPKTHYLPGYPNGEYTTSRILVLGWVIIYSLQSIRKNNYVLVSHFLSTLQPLYPSTRLCLKIFEHNCSVPPVGTNADADWHLEYLFFPCHWKTNLFHLWNYWISSSRLLLFWLFTCAAMEALQLSIL